MTNETESRGAQSADLQCKWVSWSVIDERTLRLDLMPFNCCDMPGAIRTAQMLCPDVVRIETFAGGVADVCYMRLPLKNGQRWVAMNK